MTSGLNFVSISLTWGRAMFLKYALLSPFWAIAVPKVLGGVDKQGALAGGALVPEATTPTEQDGNDRNG